MQANVLRQSATLQGSDVQAWLLPLLVVTAMLQSLVTAASLWAIGLVAVAVQSGTLQDFLGVATALAGPLVSVGLHVLFLA